jgi:hypothetical protein
MEHTKMETIVLQEAMVTINDDNRDLAVDHHVKETGVKAVELS